MPKGFGYVGRLYIHFRLYMHRPVTLLGTLLVSNSVQSLAAPPPTHSCTLHTNTCINTPTRTHNQPHAPLPSDMHPSACIMNCTTAPAPCPPHTSATHHRCGTTSLPTPPPPLSPPHLPGTPTSAACASGTVDRQAAEEEGDRRTVWHSMRMSRSTWMGRGWRR